MKTIIAIQLVQPVPASDTAHGKQEGRFEVEDDEQDRDEVEADVELRAAVLERREAALIFGELVGVGLVGAGEAADDHRQHDERPRQRQRDGKEQQDRQISGGDAGQGELQSQNAGARS